MPDDAKEQAWQRCCEELEALGIDPYSPKVAEDHEHYDAVQSILAEYEAATSGTPMLPPDWEGHEPVEAVETISGLTEWLSFQLTLIKGRTLGGVEETSRSIESEARVIRNAFRVLTWLDADEKPPRPLPPETLAEAREQIDILRRWARDEHRSGWTPKPQKAASAAKPRTTRKKPRKQVDYDELSLQVLSILKQNPDTSSRSIGEELGVTASTVIKTESWKKHQAKRKAAKAFAGKRERQLTDEMLAARGTDASPESQAMEREAIWNWLLNMTSKQGKQQEYEELMLLKGDRQLEMIEAVREQYEDAVSRQDE